MEHNKESRILFDEILCTESTESGRKQVISLEDAEKLFHENLRLVGSVARQYIGVADFDDLLQEGYIGLWNSCLYFDPSRGLQFSTYAVPLISFQIRRFLRDNNSIIRLPRSYHTIATCVSSHKYEVPLSDEEIDIIVEETGISRDRVVNYNNYSMTSIDADKSIHDDNSLSLIDQLTDYDDVSINLTDYELEEFIDKILEYLPFTDRDKDIIEEYLYAKFEGDTSLTQDKLGQKYNSSQVHSSRIISKANKIFLSHKDEILSLLGK